MVRRVDSVSVVEVTDALLAASAAHAGFSVVVTVVVYPALADRAGSDPDWPARHDAHSRRIVWVVGPLYLLVAAACLATLVSGPGPAALVAVAGNGAAAVVTATLAAPTHGRLGREGPTPALVSRLLRADRVRTAAALLALAASLVASLLA